MGPGFRRDDNGYFAYPNLGSSSSQRVGSGPRLRRERRLPLVKTDFILSQTVILHRPVTPRPRTSDFARSAVANISCAGKGCRVKRGELPKQA